MEALRKEYQSLCQKFEELKTLARINLDLLFLTINKEESPQAWLELDKVNDLVQAVLTGWEESESESITIKSSTPLQSDHRPPLMDTKSIDRYLDEMALSFTQQEVMDAFNRFLGRSSLIELTGTSHRPYFHTTASGNDFTPSFPPTEDQKHSHSTVPHPVNLYTRESIARPVHGLFEMESQREMEENRQNTRGDLTSPVESNGPHGGADNFRGLITKDSHIARDENQNCGDIRRKLIVLGSKSKDLLESVRITMITSWDGEENGGGGCSDGSNDADTVKAEIVGESCTDRDTDQDSDEMNANHLVPTSEEENSRMEGGCMDIKQEVETDVDLEGLWGRNDMAVVTKTEDEEWDRQLQAVINAQRDDQRDDVDVWGVGTSLAGDVTDVMETRDRQRRQPKQFLFEDDEPQRLTKAERKKMSNARYMARVKSDPVTFEGHRKKESVRKKESRRLMSEEQRNIIREQTRLRNIVYRAHKKTRKREIPAIIIKPKKNTRTGNKEVDDRRERNKLSQQKRRLNMTSQKKQREKERNNRYYHEAKVNKKSSTSPSAKLSIATLTHQLQTSPTAHPILPSTHQPILPSTHQPILPSTHQPILPSTHQPSTQLQMSPTAQSTPVALFSSPCPSRCRPERTVRIKSFDAEDVGNTRACVSKSVINANYRAKIMSDPVKAATFKTNEAERLRKYRSTLPTEKKEEQKSKRRARDAKMKIARKKTRKREIPAIIIKPKKNTRTGNKEVDDRRERNKLSQQKRRLNMTSQKKQREKERNDRYYHEVKVNKKSSTSPSAKPSIAILTHQPSVVLTQLQTPHSFSTD